MKKIIYVALICLILIVCLALNVAAEDTMEAEKETATWGENLLALLEEHMAELFSGLTLVGSMVLAYSYKKGLVPTLWGGLSSIAKTAESTSERTRELAEAAETGITAMTDAAGPIFEKIEKMCEGADQLAQKARELEARIAEAEGDRALVKCMMSGVADMLYGVFSAANLPQYAKEQIGEKYNAIIRVLGESCHEESQDSSI